MSKTAGSAKDPKMPDRQEPKVTVPYPTTSDPERGIWASKAEFILSCMGYAIGISNVWRFPYLCYRSGGGAFLVPFLLMLVFCGIPLFFLETVLGQFCSRGCISMFRISPLFKGTGFAIMIVNIFCLIYYNVILSYPITFIAMSMRAELPWEKCGHEWNTENCRELAKYSADMTMNQTLASTSPAYEFFHNAILHISEGIESPGKLVWTLVLSNFVSWVIIFACISRGVRSVGKVVYFTATFPYIILISLLIRGLTLDGAFEGVKYFVIPQWDRLGDPKVWADAATQMFFGLGPGWGGIVNMSSYNQFRNNSKWDSIIVPIINVSTSILAGFVVFSVLGYMSHQTGIPIDQVATGGPGLAFVTYPEAISMMPVNHLWAFLFFFMLYLLGMDSLFVQIEAVVSGLTDEIPFLNRRRHHTTLAACCIMFLLSLSCNTEGGMYVLNLLDYYSATVSVIAICFVEVIIIGWIYGLKAFVRDIEFMIEEPVHWWWKISWKYIVPIILVCMFLTTCIYNTRITYEGIVQYPDWAVILGWCTAGLSIICIPSYMIYILYRTPGTVKQRFMETSKASPAWGPARLQHRTQWETLKKSQETPTITDT